MMHLQRVTTRENGPSKIILFVGSPPRPWRLLHWVSVPWRKRRKLPPFTWLSQLRLTKEKQHWQLRLLRRLSVSRGWTSRMSTSREWIWLVADGICGASWNWDAFQMLALSRDRRAAWRPSRVKAALRALSVGRPILDQLDQKTHLPPLLQVS